MAVAAVALLGASTWALVDHLLPPRTYVIQVGYVFDVSDPELVAGYADVLAVVTVEDTGHPSPIDVDHYTDYRVSVHEVLKGDVLEPEVTVRQHGARDAGWAGEDTYVLDEQPLLQAGQEYVLALTEEAGPAWMVLGGPLSARPLPGDEAERAEVLASWRRAIEHQRMPDV